MVLLLYRDAGLKEPLPRDQEGRWSFMLPRNRPGGVCKDAFYILNDGNRPVEDLEIVTSNNEVRFFYESTIPPRGRLMVTAEWRAPLSVKQYLRTLIMIRCVEVSRPP